MQNEPEEPKRDFKLELSPGKGNKEGETAISPELQESKEARELEAEERERIREKVKGKEEELPMTPEIAADIKTSAKSFKESGDIGSQFKKLVQTEGMDGAVRAIRIGKQMDKDDGHGEGFYIDQAHDAAAAALAKYYPHSIT